MVCPVVFSVRGVVTKFLTTDSACNSPSRNDVADVHADIGNRGLKQVGYLALCQPNRLVLKTGQKFHPSEMFNGSTGQGGRAMPSSGQV